MWGVWISEGEVERGKVKKFCEKIKLPEVIPPAVPIHPLVCGILLLVH